MTLPFGFDAALITRGLQNPQGVLAVEAAMQDDIASRWPGLHTRFVGRDELDEVADQVTQEFRQRWREHVGIPLENPTPWTVINEDGKLVFQAPLWFRELMSELTDPSEQLRPAMGGAAAVPGPGDAPALGEAGRP